MRRRGQVKAFLRGMASTGDMLGVLHSPAVMKSDAEAIASDWAQVRQDIRHAMRSDTSIELWHAYRRRGMLPGVSVSAWPWIVAILAGFVLVLLMAGCARITPQVQADRALVGAELVRANSAPEVFEAFGRLTAAHDEAAKLAALTQFVKPVIEWAVQLGLGAIERVLTPAPAVPA
jgi:hypothetical protein